MFSNLQLGQKLNMSLDDLIKQAQKSKPKKQSNSKTQEGVRIVKAAKGKRARKASGTGTAKANNPSNQVTQNSGVSKKTASKTAPQKTAPLKTGKNGALRKNQTKQPKKYQAPQAAQALSNKDLVAQVRMNLNSKKDAHEAIRLAKQLQVEAQKLLGVSAGGAPRQQHVPRPKAATLPQRADRQPQSRRAPYCATEQQFHEPETQQEDQQEDQRLSDSDMMNVDDEPRDIKPNIHALRAQASTFARGVRGQGLKH